MPRARQAASGASAASAAAAPRLITAEAAESHGKIVFLRVLDKLKTRKNPDLKNMAIEEAIEHIRNFQSYINLEVSKIQYYESEIKTISVSGLEEEDMLDKIHDAKKNMVEAKNQMEKFISKQKFHEYQIDIEILKETDPDNKKKLTSLQEKLKSIYENIDIRERNSIYKTSMHANSKLNLFKGSSLSILTGLYNALKENFNTAIENLAQTIVDLIDQQLIDRQINESNRINPHKMMDLYMAKARDILDGFNDEDIKSNKYIIWLKDDFNTDLGLLRSRIEQRLKERAEQYYGIKTNTANGAAAGAAVGAAASGAAQSYPEGGTSEGGRRKKTRRSRHKRHVTAKYRK